jgi:hypothetical protein
LQDPRVSDSQRKTAPVVELHINHASKILELVDLLRRYARCLPGLLQISADDL